jgi:hypothetical protein
MNMKKPRPKQIPSKSGCENIQVTEVQNSYSVKPAMTNAHESLTKIAGSISVRSGTLKIGDSDVPPRGDLIQNVPVGLWPVTCKFLIHPEFENITSFSVEFSKKRLTSETVTASIDGGVMAIADPDIELQFPLPFFARWRTRRKLRQATLERTLAGLTKSPKSRYVDEFQRDDGTSWCVVFEVSDGIYTIVVERDKAGDVAHLYCNIPY